MRDFLAKQFDDKFLWVPFIVAFGAGLYFALPFAPNILFWFIAFIVCGAGLVFRKNNFVLFCATLFIGGFLYAAFYTHYLVKTPVMKYDMRDQEIIGVVHDIDFTDDKVKIILNIPATDLRIESKRRANIKMTITNDMPPPQIGDVIQAKASVFSPSPMEAPETFDYARWSFFNNLTGTGYITEYNILNHNDIHAINHIRHKIHEKSNSFLTDGLVLGYKNSVPKKDKDIWSTVGVGHIWSISGFHMTLIGGWLFAFFYLICRSIGFITRRVPARIVACVCAWSVLFGYVCISGAAVATMRAFLMTSLLFIALLVGRNAISMRNISIAFLILFLINPHFVMHAGFQLSFAAIYGLIWFFGDKSFSKNISWFQKVKSWIYVATMTSLVATFFTLPFIATHFNYIPVYSLIGNLILLPVFSVLILPLVIIGTICAMFGGHLFLDWATHIYDFSLRIAQMIVDLPMSNLAMPHISNMAFIIFVIGLMCLILIKPMSDSGRWILRRINCLLCGIFILCGIIIVATQSRPVFYATNDHELIGMVYDNKLEFNKARAANHYFAFNAFRELNGEKPSDENIRRKCPNGVCIYKSEKFSVAYIQKFKPLQEHLVSLCRDDDIKYIVSYFDISGPKCNHKILHNGFVIYKSGRVKHTPFNRWWHNPHE